MPDLLADIDGTTPLDADDLAGLKLTYITTRAELNAVEGANILHAEQWLMRQKRLTLDSLLSEHFVRQLHKKMFGDVWQWAGMYRRTDKTIGVPHFEIRNRLPSLLGNVQCWIDHTTYSADEIAVRFHHELVAIHPFTNGNGRHARLMADQLIKHLGEPPFTWGGELLTTGQTRQEYVEALRQADARDMTALLRFARA